MCIRDRSSFATSLQGEINQANAEGITVVTDSITVNSSWFRAPSDFFCVANDETAEVLKKGGVAKEQIKVLGIPVSPLFAENPNDLRAPIGDEPRRVLYVINTGKKKRATRLTGCWKLTTCISQSPLSLIHIFSLLSQTSV